MHQNIFLIGAVGAFPVVSCKIRFKKCLQMLKNKSGQTDKINSKFQAASWNDTETLIIFIKVTRLT